MKTWRELEKPHSHYYISDDDFCIYAREYISHAGYQGGQTNRYITNFKKSPDKRETVQWGYRKQAIEAFSKEARLLFKPYSQAAITAIPSSTAKNDSEYDNRFEDLFTELQKSRPNLNIEWPIAIKQTIKSSHLGGDRDPETFKKNCFWKGFRKGHPKMLIIFDDVLTTGAHFRAMSDFLKKNGYEGEIVGVFWARTISG